RRIAMRKLILVIWLLVPLAVAAFHFGPGQDLQRVDRAGAALARAERAAARARTVAAQEGDAPAREHWAEAVVAYGEALEHLPDGHGREARHFRLERAKAMMYVSQLPDARRELEALLEEMSADPERDEAVLADARTALASAHYYTTWLMRLEGL